MEDIALKELWQGYNRKMEQCLVINQRNTMDVTRMKVHTLVSSMKPIKVFTLVVGILWVVPIGFVLVNLFLHAYDKVSPFFLYSAALQVLVTAIAIGIYIYQLDLMYKLDFSEPVVEIQEKLSKLRLSTLWSARILFLQLPAWTTFYLTEKTIVYGATGWIIFQCVITALFLLAALWIFCRVRYENRHKRWFRWIFTGSEWTPLIRSIELLDDIETIKNQDPH